MQLGVSMRDVVQDLITSWPRMVTRWYAGRIWSVLLGPAYEGIQVLHVR